MPDGAAAIAAKLADPSARLAEFAAGLRLSDIPERVRLRAVHHILDAVGIAFVSSRQDFAHRTLTAIGGLAGAGSVPILGLPARLPPRDAALVNGVLCHGLDFDDTHLGGVVHASASAFPAALSAAILAGASGEALLLAYIIAIEVTSRIGAVGRGAFHARGFHPTGVAGVFGAALAASRLFGLTAREMQATQGIALSMASGSLEFLEDGAWNKRMHPGWAAQAGLTAAALGRQGFVGATRPYAGRYGLYNLYTSGGLAACDLAAATAGLGSVWELERTAIKPYPACHFTHASIDAALLLREAGLRAEQVASIDARMPEQVIAVVCEPQASKRHPANTYDAQFSIPFLVSAALVRGRLSLAELDAIDDPEILALAGRVGYSVDPSSPFPRSYSGELVVTTTDGRTLRQREEVNRGAPERPLSNEDILDKYNDNAAIALNPDGAARVCRAVLELAAAPTAAGFAATLANEGPRA
ncbi:MAG: MmgE/PrpD family protein [Rhodospirillales bacterium]|nr:MmgE/PrpD family protein [Rhodospirillales bacterium]MDE2198023.1 MmgE/PrpD family protein [Rhodospirillales bacterium]MDE2574585.1 MmgE/PrpD family protein [Rhodospirillales bacterium]